MSDAKAAFKSLVHSTHLYGRRLVVEFASGDSSLEELRSKTRKQWEAGLSFHLVFKPLQPPSNVIDLFLMVAFMGRWGWRKEVQADEDRGGRDDFGR